MRKQGKQGGIYGVDKREQWQSGVIFTVNILITQAQGNMLLTHAHTYHFQITNGCDHMAFKMACNEDDEMVNNAAVSPAIWTIQDTSGVLLRTTRWTPCNNLASLFEFKFTYCRTVIGFFIITMTVEVGSLLPKKLSLLFALTITPHLIVSFFSFCHHPSVPSPPSSSIWLSNLHPMHSRAECLLSPLMVDP